MEIRQLHSSDERTTFRSGDDDLDRFFHRYAAQNQFQHYVGTTYVAVDKALVLAFATVAPGHIEIDDLPAAERKRLPQYPLPILRLARLAVDASVQRQRLGATLLRFVLRLAIDMARDYGCIGVVADAKPAALNFYARFGFVALEAVEGQSDARPQPTPMFLSLKTIKSASRK